VAALVRPLAPMTPYQVYKWRRRFQMLLGIGILERFARPKLCWFWITAKPLPEARDYTTFYGGNAEVWVAHSDRTVAEEIARKLIADERWFVCSLLSSKIVTRWTYRRLMPSFGDYARRCLSHFEQAVLVGHSAHFNRVGLEPEDEDDEAPA
jgi:hypothetical protein